MTEPDAAGNAGDAGAGGSGGAGDGTPTFLETIQNEELRGSDHLKEIDSPDSLAEKYVGLINSQPQIPEGPDGYKMDMPEGTSLNEEDFKSFQEKAHELGMTQDQWQAVVMYDAERVNKIMEEDTAKVEEAITELKGEWGEKYDENMASAVSVLDKTGFKDLADDEALRSSPKFARFLHHISTAVSEDKLVPGHNPPAGGKTVGEDGEPMLKFDDMD